LSAHKKINWNTTISVSFLDKGAVLLKWLITVSGLAKWLNPKLNLNTKL
jgi:hypothetical protein